MNVYTFSAEKNQKLIEERNISFEEIISAIYNSQIDGIQENPNIKKYKNQKIFVVFPKNYVYLVPFILELDGTIFLKTIIPSRKAKKLYREER